LQRVINQQSSSKVINLLRNNIQRDEYLNFLLETLKMDESHPFRERVSREDLSQSLMQSYPSDSREAGTFIAQDRVFRWTRLIRILSCRLPRWLVSNKSIVSFFIDKLPEYAEDAKKSRDLDNMSEPILKDQFQIILKIIVEYCTHEKSNIDFAFKLHEMSTLKINNDFGFLKRFFKYTLPKNYVMASQKKIFLRFLDMIQNTQEQELIRQTSLGMILPILCNLFKEKKDVLILSPEVVGEMRKKIKILQENKKPAWVNMEITLLLDYIVSRMNFRREDPGISDLLNDILYFAWRNIGHPRDNSKRLKNLSKLLVSRLISRYKI
jgi:hypothetical protein